VPDVRRTGIFALDERVVPASVYQHGWGVHC